MPIGHSCTPEIGTREVGIAEISSPEDSPDEDLGELAIYEDAEISAFPPR